MALREQGLSYSEIRNIVHVSKGTLSVWLRNVKLNEQLRENLKKKCGHGRSGPKSRLAWDNKRLQVRKNYEPPFNEPLFLFGLALYWGEGTKHSPNTVEMVNTDPQILCAYIAWSRRFFMTPSHRFSVTVHHHHGIKNDQVILLHWSTALGLPLTAFTKCVHVKPRSRAESNCDGHGTAQIKIAGSGIWKIRARIQKAIEESRVYLNW